MEGTLQRSTDKCCTNVVLCITKACGGSYTLTVMHVPLQQALTQAAQDGLALCTLSEPTEGFKH